MKTEGRRRRGRVAEGSIETRGVVARQPERSSRSPLSLSLGQPCNFRPLLSSSLPEATFRCLPRASALCPLRTRIFIDLCACINIFGYLFLHLYMYLYLVSDSCEFLYISLLNMFVFIFSLYFPRMLKLNLRNSVTYIYGIFCISVSIARRAILRNNIRCGSIGENEGEIKDREMMVGLLNDDRCCARARREISARH